MEAFVFILPLKNKNDRLKTAKCVYHTILTLFPNHFTILSCLSKKPGTPHLMKKLILLLLAISSTAHLFAATNITTPNVSGSWTLAGSPYLVFNNITVDPGQKLIIDPGVEVIFQGFYEFKVYGSLFADGSAAKPILFHAKDTAGWYNSSAATGGWKGITALAANPLTDSCTFKHCDIYDTKSNAVWFRETNVSFSYCRFFHNNGYVFQGLLDTGKKYIFSMSHCHVYDNRSALYGFLIGRGVIRISETMFYNNTAGITCFNMFDCDLLFDKNGVSHNTADGTIVDIVNSNAVVSGNSIQFNTASEQASLSFHDSHADVIGNFITNNESTKKDDGGSTCGIVQGGAGIRLSSPSGDPNDVYTVRNNVIANNEAAFAGGGIYIIAASANIINNTLVNNHSYWGGGIYMFNNVSGYGHRFVKIKNNLFLNNTSGGLRDPRNLHIGSADSLQYDYNWVQQMPDIIDLGFNVNVWMGDTLTNVIGTDPGILRCPYPDLTDDATLGDYRLSPTAACIDKGDTTGAFPSAKDFDNQQRIYGTKIDIGACEYSPAAIGHVGISNTAPATTGMATYPNPAYNMLFVATPAAQGTIQLLDVTGKVMAEQKATNTLTTFNIRQLPRGIYLAIWSNTNGSKETQKIILE